MAHDFRSIAAVAPDERIADPREFSAAPVLTQSVDQGIGPLLRKEDFRAFQFDHLRRAGNPCP
jgi:hypothetical protein